MKRSFLSLILVVALVFSSVCLIINKASIGSTADKNDTENIKNNTSNIIDPNNHHKIINYDEVKAIWVSQFDMSAIYTEAGRQRNVEDYTKKVEKMVSNICSLGINTVIFQLRPNGDSIYPSALYPTSKYVTDGYGKEAEYDPFTIFLEIAHRYSLSVHAWINPLRCMSESDIALIDNTYKIKNWYLSEYGKYIVAVNGMLYLNPAYKEVRGLICDGVAEILRLYEVDGIHMDDYFYPTTDTSFDSSAYSLYKEKGGELSLADFRRESIDALVNEIYDTVKAKNKDILFGISPGGNTDRNYNELYADVAKWCQNEGYIDYICPQVYFGFEHETRPFDQICEEFSDMTEGSDARLIIGITLGKAYDAHRGAEDIWAGTGAKEWIENKDILVRSLSYANGIKNCSGVAIFSYRLIFDPLSGERIEETATECQTFLPLLKE